MYFKKQCISAIEPIRFVTPLFNFFEDESVLCSPISSVQRFPLLATQDLNADVSRKDLHIYRLQWVIFLTFKQTHLPKGKAY